LKVFIEIMFTRGDNNRYIVHIYRIRDTEMSIYTNNNRCCPYSIKCSS